MQRNIIQEFQLELSTKYRLNWHLLYSNGNLDKVLHFMNTINQVQSICPHNNKYHHFEKELEV